MRIQFSYRSSNSLADYQVLASKGVVLASGENVSGDSIDQQDSALLGVAHSKFRPIIDSDEACIALARVVLRFSSDQFPLPAPGFSPAPDDCDKHQSLMELSIRIIEIFSDEQPNAPERTPFLDFCYKTDLFYRGSYPRFSSLFKLIESVPEEDLDPRQLASHPGRHQRPCPPPFYRNGDEWTWPKRHMVSYGHSLKILHGMIGKMEVLLKPRLGLMEKDSTYEIFSRGNLTMLQESFSGGVYWDGNSPKIYYPSDLSSECCVGYKSYRYVPYDGHILTEKDRRKPYLPYLIGEGAPEPFWHPVEEHYKTEPPSVAFTADLIRAGIHPYAVIDTTEVLKGKVTNWKDGDLNPHYLPAFHFAARYSSPEIVEAYMSRAIEVIRSEYSNSGGVKTLWFHACMNRKNLSVLIPLYKEALDYPSGDLTREIRELKNTSPAPPSMFPSYRHLFTDQKWRLYSQNHLILACWEGSLPLAEYLVEKEVERVRLFLDRNPPENDSEMERLKIEIREIGYFVNQPSRFWGPLGTPLEIAERYKRWEIIRFFASKGVLISSEVCVQANRELADEARKEREKSQETVRSLINRLGGEATYAQIDAILSVLTESSKRLGERQKTLEKSQDMIEEINEDFDAIDAELDRMEKEAAFVKSLMEMYNVRISRPVSGSRVESSPEWERAF